MINAEKWICESTFNIGNLIKWYCLQLASRLGPTSQSGFMLSSNRLQLIQRREVQPLKELKGHSDRVKCDDLHTTPSRVTQRCPHSGVTTLHRLLLISTFTAMSRSPVLHCTQTLPLWRMEGHTFTNGWPTIRFHCGCWFLMVQHFGIKCRSPNG